MAIFCFSKRLRIGCTYEVFHLSSLLLNGFTDTIFAPTKFYQEIRLGLHRSDYMLDEKTKSLLQIELNTIASSFAGLSNLVTELHR